jgi:pimeloyl-ACP methyl ester carboxylesterase
MATIATTKTAPQAGRRPWRRWLRYLVLLLAAAVLIVYLSFRNDLAAAQRRVASIPSNMYHSPYGDIEYLLVGDGATVLVAHGITGGIDQGESLVTRWRNIGDGYRFLYVSRFGYLKSSLPEGATVRLQAAAYKDLLDHLGIDRVFVLGNSAGGASAMWFTIDYPERTNGLILLSSAVPGPEVAPIPKPAAEHDFVYWAAVEFAPDMLIGLLLPDAVKTTLTEQDKHFVVENAFMASLPISERTKGIFFDNAVSVPGVNDVPFERIQAPTLIFQSVDDPRELRGGHFLLHHEQEIQAANAEFIAKHSNGSR